MRKYVLYSAAEGYLGNSWESFFESALHRSIFLSQTPNLQVRLGLLPLASRPTLPEYYYHHSPAAVTAKFQYLTRAGLFHTNMRIGTWKDGDSTACTCGERQQSKSHVFVYCPNFEQARQKAVARSLHRHRLESSDDLNLSMQIRGQWEQYLREAIWGSPRWSTQYWLGSVPPIPSLLGSREYREAHEMVILLTARLGGALASEARQARMDREGTVLK
jgi:hypothetical protein